MQDLLTAILARPDDDGPRLVYADHLTEAGDARGELIGVQVALARLDAGDPRRAALEARDYQLRAEHQEWTQAFRGHVEGLRWERGFVVRVAAQPRRFAAGAHVVLEAAPLLRGLEGIGGDSAIVGGIAALARCPHLARLVELDLGSLNVGWEGARELAGSAYVAGLRRLDLSNNSLMHGDVAVFSAFGSLKALDLSGNWIGRGLGALALPELTELRASSTFAGDDGLASLAESDMPLRGLSFASNRVGMAGLSALASSRLPLRYLDLSSNRIGPTGIAVLSRSDVLAGLRTLRLGKNALGDGGVRALVSSPACAQLERLDLESASLEDESARLLAASALPAAVRLDVSHNRFSDEAKALLRHRFSDVRL